MRTGAPADARTAAYIVRVGVVFAIVSGCCYGAALVLHEHFTVNATLGSLVLLSGLAVAAVPARRGSLPVSLPRSGPARPVGDSA